MTRYRSMKRMAVTAAVAMAMCAMSSPSGAGGIWGGNGHQHRASDARTTSARTALDARAGWRVAEARAASDRASDGTRAGWRLVARVVAARAGW